MFENLNMQDGIETERDVLGGGSFVLETGLYDLTIDKAWGSQSAGGAKAVNFEFSTDDGKTLRATIYVSNKQGQNFYEKDGKKNYLPGFLLVNNLCLLTVKKELSQVGFEDKTLNLYDFDAKKELPTKSKVPVELINQRITAGVFKDLVDKTKKNDATGNYEPTGETREQNEIDKFFRISDGMTVAELRAKETEAKFKTQWSEKHTGNTRNKAKGTSGKSAPAKSAGTTQAKAPTKSLFDE